MPREAPQRQRNTGVIGETLDAIKEFFYPALAAERKQRHHVFQNFAIFGAAIVSIVVFEDKLKHVLDFADKEL